ncbi:MAG TPA: TolC family protein [Flavobacterium sp.]
MRNSSFLSIMIALIFSLSLQAQTKKWTIQEVVAYALEHNIQIQQTALDIELAAIDKKGAIGNFLPSANASLSHSWNIGLSQNPATFEPETQTLQQTGADISVGVDIYKGLQNRMRFQRSKLAILAAQYNLSKMKDDTSLMAASAFLDILFSKENLKVQKELLANNQKQMERTNELVNAGSIPRGDLMDMRATVATSNQNVVAAENSLLIAKLSLAQLLQLEDFKDFDVADVNAEIAESPTMMQTPEAIFEKAKEERMELKIARANLDLAEKDIRIAKGALQPNLTGFYSFSSRVTNAPVPILDENGNFDGTTVPAFFNQFSDNKGHNFGVQLNIPILNGFTTRNNIARAEVAKRRSEIAYSQAELDLERNVYQAFTDARGALNAYESAVAAMEARQEAYNYANEKYQVGMMNAFDFNQAQTLFANAQSEVIRAKYEYIFKVKVVEFYFGIPIIQN